MNYKKLKRLFSNHGPLSASPLYAATKDKHGRVLSVGPKWVHLMTGAVNVKVPTTEIERATY